MNENAPQGTDTPPLFELRDAEGVVAWRGNDRKGIGEAELAGGTYVLWKRAGVLAVEEEAEVIRRRATFASAVKKGPRKPKAAAEPQAAEAATGTGGGGILSRLRG